MTISSAQVIETEPPPSNPLKTLQVTWWNANDFAHLDPDRTAFKRWPQSRAQYVRKCAAVDAVLQGCAQEFGEPDVLALAEITRTAAEELRNRLLPDYRVFSLDFSNTDPTFQIAFLYRDLPCFSECAPIVVPFMPRHSRPMGAIDFTQGDQQIRIVAAHWTSPWEDESQRNQERLASHLNHSLFDYLESEDYVDLNRNTIVLGDFNNEPFELMHSHFYATRSRARSRRQGSYHDADTHKVRLYNCAWRLLGERTPHRLNSQAPEVAGSCYFKKAGGWMTVDQILVSAGLLTERVPYLIEDSVDIFYGANLLGADGFPEPFEWDGTDGVGVSDHLPITARLQLL